MFFSPDMFIYLTFEYGFFKTSKILIFGRSVNFTDHE